MKIIDNFLNKTVFNNIQKVMMGHNFPWYFQTDKEKYNLEKNPQETVNDLSQFQFTHLFYERFYPKSADFNTLNPLFNKLKVRSLLKCKANLNPYSQKLMKGFFHVDSEEKDSLTAVYYLNTNNGYTMFKEKSKKVMSKENRVVIFNTKMEHYGTNTTDSKSRVVLNLNYF